VESLKEQIWGVHPRAPGISFQPTGKGTPGLPAAGKKKNTAFCFEADATSTIFPDVE